MIAHFEGLPRTAGRVLAMRLYDGERVSFGQFATALKFTHGNISSSMRMLESQQLLKRAAKAGDRQDYFQIADNAFANMVGALAARARLAVADIEESLNEIPLSETGACRQLRSLLSRDE